MKTIRKITLLMSSILILGCSNSNAKNDGDQEDSMAVVEIVEIADEPADDSDEASLRYERELAKLKDDRSNIICYTDGWNIWYYRKTPGGYGKFLKVYDSQDDTTSTISLNKTRDFSDSDITIQGIVANSGKITVIIEEARNSNGWVEGTSVWTINCADRSWTPVARGVAGAEFQQQGKAVKVTRARIINPDDIVAAQEYDYSYTTIDLDNTSTQKKNDSSDIALIRKVYDTYVFGYSESNPSKYFTAKAIRKLRDAYDYDCPDESCYAFWELRTGAQDVRSDRRRIVSIEPDGSGWYKVSYDDGGYPGTTRIKIVDGKIDDYRRLR